MYNPAQFDLIVLDFDGVLTNNKVYISESGDETVRCDRSDGQAINAFKKLGIQPIILTTEQNPVVEHRASKLGIPLIRGSSCKEIDLQQFLDINKTQASRIIYVGNDVNDLGAMRLASVSFCPHDSHQSILSEATHVLITIGGSGVLREIVEQYLKVDIYTLLYSPEAQA